MLVYATLQMAITTLPINADEFNQLLEQVKNNFELWAASTWAIKDIYIQWQQIRRQLLVLDPDVFGRSIDDIEDQLDLMSLGNFVYCQPVDLWQEYPRYLKRCYCV